jgi:hypothetical protein
MIRKDSPVFFVSWGNSSFTLVCTFVCFVECGTISAGARGVSGFPKTHRPTLRDVSVSRIVNHGSLMLSVPDKASVDAEMDKIFNRLVRLCEPCWLRADRRPVAVLLELRTACQLTDLPLLITVTEHAFVPRCDRNSVDGKHLEEIMMKFAARARPNEGSVLRRPPGPTS